MVLVLLSAGVKEKQTKAPHPSSALHVFNVLDSRMQNNLEPAGAGCRSTCLEGVEPGPVRRVHLGGVGPRAHVGENHNSVAGKTIQSWRLPFNVHGGVTEASTRYQPPIRRLAPGISWRGAPVNISDAPERKIKLQFFFFFKVRGRTRNSPRLLMCVRSVAARVARCAQREIGGETAAPWRPGGRAAQRSSASVRVCTDYCLPPRDPPINRQSIRRQRAGSLRDPAPVFWNHESRHAPPPRTI